MKRINFISMLILMVVWIGSVAQSPYPDIETVDIPINVVDHVGTDVDMLNHKLRTYGNQVGLTFAVMSYEKSYNSKSMEDYWMKYSTMVLVDDSFNNKLEVYIVPNDDPSPMKAFAIATLDEDLLYKYPSYFNKIVIQDKGIKDNTLAHEIGHLYGNRHTFNDGTDWACLSPCSYGPYNYMSYEESRDNYSEDQISNFITYHRIRNRSNSPGEESDKPPSARY